MDYIGDPDFQSQFWELQHSTDDCAVAAQASIINQYSDQPVSFDDVEYVAEANGWYHPGSGTQQADVGDLFGAYGIPYHTVDDATVKQLASELQQGHRVVVGVDAEHLWQNEGPLAEFFDWAKQELGLGTADHAVAVTGIDVSDPSNPSVLLNDTGDPNGKEHAYPLDQFMNAWKGSDFHYVATNQPPAASQNSAATSQTPGFDVGEFLGVGSTIIAEIGGVDPATAHMVGDAVVSLTDVDWDHLLANS